MEEAIQKHGVVTPPKKYEDKFHDKINEKRKDLA